VGERSLAGRKIWWPSTGMKITGCGTGILKATTDYFSLVLGLVFLRERKGGEDNYQRPSFEPEFSFAWLVVLCLLLPSLVYTNVKDTPAKRLMVYERKRKG